MVAPLSDRPDRMNLIGCAVMILCPYLIGGPNLTAVPSP